MCFPNSSVKAFYLSEESMDKIPFQLHPNLKLIVHKAQSIKTSQSPGDGEVCYCATSEKTVTAFTLSLTLVTNFQVNFKGAVKLPARVFRGGCGLRW